MKKEIENKVMEILEKECYKDERGYFYSEIYRDYRDNLSDDLLVPNELVRDDKGNIIGCQSLANN